MQQCNPSDNRAEIQGLGFSFSEGEKDISNFKTYETIADVPEIRVWWRADFQSGSRVLKKGVLKLFLSISIAYNVISCQKVAENTQILKIAKFAM